jgi:hypothetical protein
MNAKQMTTVVIGGILLVLSLVFPYTRYPIQKRSEGGLSITVHHEHMPIWKALEQHDEAKLKGNVFSDTTILWGRVFTYGAVILTATQCVCFLLRSRPSESPRQLGPDAGR